jgi:hypothetical protein
MNEEILRIQKMVAEGKITPEEGAELVETVRAGGPPTQVPTTTAATPSRFSRKAIIGAAWVPFLLIAAPLLFFSRGSAEYHGPEWWEYLLGFTLLPLGVAAPFGTTILGAIALAQIRRSAGRLCGLALALFDVLLFPLLALDGVIFLLFYFILPGLGTALHPGALVVPQEGAALFATIIISLVVDATIIWLAWRAATKPVKGVSP